jgi:hypothetical protein
MLGYPTGASDTPQEFDQQIVNSAAHHLVVIPNVFFSLLLPY